MSKYRQEHKGWTCCAVPHKEGIVIVLSIFVYVEGAAHSQVMVGNFTKKAEAETLLYRKSPFPPMVARNASLAGNSVFLFGQSLRGNHNSSIDAEKGTGSS